MDAGISSQVATTDYLTLLTIQLKNQDPINPVKQEDFLAQLSQFSMLEGMENLNTSFEDMLRLQEISQGINLVGRQVEYQEVGTETIRRGTVDRFVADTASLQLIVDGQQIPIQRVTSVTA